MVSRSGFNKDDKRMYELARQAPDAMASLHPVRIPGLNVEPTILVGSVMLFAMSAPFALQLAGSGEEGGGQGIKPYYLYLRILMTIVFIVWSFKEPERLSAAIKANPWPLALWIFAVLSAMWSFDPYITLRAAIELFSCVLFSYVLTTRYDSRSIAIMLLHALGFSLIFSIIWVGLFPDIAVHGEFDIVQEGHAGSWRGIYYHKNMLGGVAGLAIPLFLGPGRRLIKGNALLFAYIVSAAVCLIQAKSSGGFSVAVAGALAVSVTSIQSKSARTTVLVLGGFAAIVCGVFLDDISYFVLELLGKDPTFTGRTYLWSAAIDLIGLHPLIGYGYPSISDPQITSIFMITYNASNAHDAYLQLLIELGFAGLAIWFLCLFCAMRGILRDFSLEEVSPEITLFLAILFALVISGFGEIAAMSLTTSPLGMIWLVVSVAAARRNSFGAQPQPDEGLRASDARASR
ncbi:O-antigen ligase family protein [Methylocella silvestris]|nr:O-antigen ligase family protein [Methylocella silvestris]